MKITSRILFGAMALSFVLSPSAWSGSKDIMIEEAWARASIGMNRPGAAYMKIHNTADEPVILNGLNSDLATMPQIHRTTMRANGVSSMEPAGELTIEAGEMVTLEPGGLHIMLMQLQRPMVTEESFELTLSFSDGGEVTVEIPIYGIAARGPNSE